MFEIYILIIICSAAAYVFNARRLPADLRYLGILILITAPKEQFTHAMHLRGEDISTYNHLFRIVEFTLMSLTYLYAFHSSHNKKTVQLFLCFYLPFSFCLLVYKEMNPAIGHKVDYNLLAGVFLFIIYSLLYIYELFENPVVDALWKLPFFWINTGVLFYYAGSFVQVGFDAYLELVNKPLAEDLNTINHILNFFLYICFTIGFLCKNQET